jgi:phenylacetate-CoA ligase
MMPLALLPPGSPHSPGAWSAAETTPADQRRPDPALLRERIEKAHREAPVYRDLWAASGLADAQARAAADLTDFPPMSKDRTRAFRARSGDLFGGLSAGLRPGAVVTRSTGTSGEPTFFVSTYADVATAADSVASYFWACGARPGEPVLLPGIGGGGTRGDLPVLEATRLVGAVLVTADALNAADVGGLIRAVGPSVVLVTQRLIDDLRSGCAAGGSTLQELFEPVRSVMYAAKSLSPGARALLSAELGSDVFDMGGIGDLALWGSQCTAHDGLHVRDDLFSIECLDPVTRREVPEGQLGELIYTSLWDEGMNFVRWDSEDVGWVRRQPCACGRTTARIAMVGRAADRFVVAGDNFYPPAVEARLSEVLGSADVFFQIERQRGTLALAGIRLAVPADVAAGDVESELSSLLGAQVRVTPASRDEILAGSPWYKYRQVVDVDRS